MPEAKQMSKLTLISNFCKTSKFYSWAVRLNGHPRFILYAVIFFDLMSSNTPAFAQPWKESYINSPFAVYWDSVASSADGTKLIAVGNMSPSGASAVFTSTNSGLTWETNNAPFAIWTAVAASADGNNLVMVAATGPILTSTNAGASWIQSTNAPMLNWSAVASSSNGMKLVVTAINNQPFLFTNGEQYPPSVPIAFSPNGSIYTSTNAGITWRSNAVYSGYYVPPIGPGWSCVASSVDGDKLFATAGFEGIYCSTNGSIWIPLDTPLNYVVSVAASGDGIRLFMTGFDNSGNDIWAVSKDGGQTWTTNIAPYGSWPLVASSADGTNILVADAYAPIYTSNDAGVTWSTNDIPSDSGYGGWSTSPLWRAIASSADGSKLIAIGDWQKIYTWQFQPTLRLTVSKTNNLISWRNLSLSSGFVLQQNYNLSSNDWTDVVSPVTDDGTNFSITLSTLTNALFFRLKK